MSNRRQRNSTSIAFAVGILTWLWSLDAQAAPNDGREIVLVSNRELVESANHNSTEILSPAKASLSLVYAAVDIRAPRPNNEEHFALRLLNADELQTTLSAGQSTAPFANSPRPLLLYVHGFANTVESATSLANRVAGMLEFPGTVAVFAWPSQGRTSASGYWADEKAAAASVDALVNVLKTLQISDGVSRIHIIAHSLGNRILLRALAKLETELRSGHSKLGQTILCSPDVETTEFLRVIRQGAVSNTQATMWVSQNDRALSTAPLLGGGTRVGLTLVSGNPVVVKGVTTIDVSEETEFFALNHNAYMQVDTLFSDLADLMNPNSMSPWLNPRKRVHYVEKKNREGLPFWRYKK